MEVESTYFGIYFMEVNYVVCKYIYESIMTPPY